VSKSPEVLEKKKFVVAGAGGLFGSSLVASILQAGAEVVATDIDLEQMITRLVDNGLDTSEQRLTICQLDLSNESAVKSFFSGMEGITGAVNCSYPRNNTYGKPFFEVSLASFNENLALHLGSAFLFSQQCAAYFKRHESPFSLVNISSIYGVVAPKFDIYDDTSMTMPVEYAAIKSAILHLTKYTAAYVCDSRFRINSISPGGIQDNQPEKFLARYKEKTLGKGMLEVDDVLGAIMFLLGEDSKYINGQNIVVDDGFTL